MKLNKKQLTSIVPTYLYYQNDPDLSETFEGIRMTLSQLGLLTQVKNEIFIQNNKNAELQIKIAEKIIKTAYNSNHQFDLEKLNDYQDDISFMTDISNADKIILKSCIDSILSTKNSE